MSHFCQSRVKYVAWITINSVIVLANVSVCNASIVSGGLWWLLAFKWAWKLPAGVGMFHGVACSACRCLADVCVRPWHSPYCCDSLKGICVRPCARVNSTEEDRAWGQDMLCPSLSLPLSLFLSPLFTMHRGLSRIGCRQRGSKLIIQCAGKVAKASAGRLEISKGPFQWKLLNIPELMYL